MRVFHFYRTYFPDSVGGIEQVIYQLCRGAAKFGVKSSVLSLTRDIVARTITLDGHEAHRARMNFQIASTSFSASAFLRFSQLAKQADIVHYHYPWPFMDVVHFATRLRKPTVVTYHSDIIRQELLLKLYRPLKHRFLASVDRIVATSPNYFATSHVLDRYRDKTVVIPIGLDKSSYPAPSPDLLAKWRSKVGERFFLFVGNIRYYKGLHILLDAAQGTNYPVVIVGSGPIEAKLKEHANRLRLRNIHFLGVLPDEDKVALLQLCYAVAFPSHLRSEAFGISLLEGAMYGKPMISSEIGTGTSYVNENGETGLVVPPSDPSAFREAMRRLWDNPELAAEMGKRAEQRYWNLFTAERMAASYADLYRKLLAKKRYELAPLFRNAEGSETMTVPRLSISIVSHRHGQLVHNLLADLNAIGLENVEVILTLNISGEQNVVPEGFSLPIVVVENPVPRGFGANHNAAFALSKGEYFCVLNPDIRIATNPFPTLIEHLATLRAGVVAPKVCNSSGKIEDNARPFPALLNPLLRAIGPRERTGATSPGPYPDWVAGMFMLFRREAFSSVGGFDEWYFLYYEDVDLCARLRVAGWEVALCESVEVVHDARHDSHKHLRYFYWHMRSMARYFLTWPRLALGFGSPSRNS